jgi:membrane protease YdiL (CAAX protease family)
VTLGRLLRTDDGRYRAPWRLLVFVVATIVGLLVAQGIFAPLVLGIARVAGVHLSLDATILCVALALAHVAALRWLDDRPWRSVAMGAGSWQPSALVTGTISGTLAIGVPILLLVGIGWLALRSAPDGSSTSLALRMLVFLAPAALAEELMFRGYPLTVLAESLGPKAAVLLTSVVFGLIHLSNPDPELGPIVMVMLAGVWLGVVRLATGSLWAAWLAHLAWNWTMAGLWHAKVSGLGLEIVDWQLADAGPDWATGGSWGPEGGVFAALGMLSGTLWFLARPRGAVRAGGVREADDTLPETRQ